MSITIEDCIRLPPPDFNVSRLQLGDKVKFLATDYNEYMAVVVHVSEPFEIIGQLFSGAVLTNTNVDFEKDVLKVLEVYREYPAEVGNRKEIDMSMRVNDFIEAPASIDTETQEREPNVFYYEDRGGMTSSADYDDEVPALSNGDLVAYRAAGNGLTWVLAVGECRGSGYVIHILPGAGPVLFSKHPAHLLEDEPMIVVSPNDDSGFSPQSIASIIQDPDMLKRFYCPCNFDIAAREETFMAWFNPKF